MNKYTFYGDGIFRNKRFSVEAKNKTEAIEKAKKENSAIRYYSINNEKSKVR